jgi:hypothetical protein
MGGWSPVSTFMETQVVSRALGLVLACTFYSHRYSNAEDVPLGYNQTSLWCADAAAKALLLR